MCEANLEKQMKLGGPGRYIILIKRENSMAVKINTESYLASINMESYLASINTENYVPSINT